MAQTRSRVAQSAFTSGKLSPLISSARIDLEKYQRGCQTLDNFLLLPQGGARRRPGTSFVVQTKALVADGSPRLIPFVYSTKQAYMLEFGQRSGAGYIRFYKDQGRIQLTVTGAANNGSGLIRITTSVAHEMATGMQVFIEGVVGTTEANGAWTVTNVAATTFDLQGSAFVNAYVSGGAVIPELVSPYLAANLPDLDGEQSADTLYLACDGFAPRKLTRSSHTSWRLRTINFRPPPTFEAPVLQTGASLTLGAVTGNGITATASVASFLNGDVSRQITAGDGRAVITTFTSTTEVTVDILDAFAGTAIAASGWSLTGSPSSTLTPSKKGPVGASMRFLSDVPATVFRAADVGKYVKIHDGIVKLNAFVASNEVRGEILVALSSTTATPSWSMESDAWTAAEGYPVAVAFSPGDRLCFARGTRVWGSVVGDYENMGVTTLDDAAFEFGLNIGQVNEALTLMASDELVCFSTAAEHVLFGGGTDEVLTPTNVRQRADTTNGSKKVRPVRVGPALLHVGASGRDIFEHVHSFEEDRHVAPSLTLLADSLFPVGKTITAMAYQRTPWSVLWCRRVDGRLFGLTYLRAEDVVGWHEHPMDGTDGVVSLAVIPHPDADREQVWMIASRVIGGATVYYVEYLNDSSLFTDANGVSYGQRGLDSSLTYSGAAATVISGLSHLNGRTVYAIADGAPVGPFTVASGSITLADAATKVEVGLPFTSVLTPVAPEVPGGMSSGTEKSMGPMFVRVVNTLGLKYSGGDGIDYEIKFREPDLSMGTVPPLFTGSKELDHIGWDDGVVTFRQEAPLPCTITMIGGVLGVGQ